MKRNVQRKAKPVRTKRFQQIHPTLELFHFLYSQFFLYCLYKNNKLFHNLIIFFVFTIDNTCFFHISCILNCLYIRTMLTILFHILSCSYKNKKLFHFLNSQYYFHILQLIVEVPFSKSNYYFLVVTLTQLLIYYSQQSKSNS